MTAKAMKSPKTILRRGQLWTAAEQRQMFEYRFRIGLNESEARDEARGEARGMARSIGMVLECRGIKLSQRARKRIEACTDTTQLSHWIGRAATMSPRDDLFA